MNSSAASDPVPAGRSANTAGTNRPAPATMAGSPEIEPRCSSIGSSHEGCRAEVDYRTVEGQINRLKMIKLQMYGRAGFTLLRARVLPYTTASSFGLAP